MTKKDEKDADRPHYYSQFWLDVAAGRKVIGAPKSEDGTDQADIDLPEPIPLSRKGGRANPNIVPADGYRETRASAAVADEGYDEEEEEEEEDFSLPEDEEPDTVDEVNDEDIPTIVDDTPEELTPDIEPELAEEEAEQEAEQEQEEPEEDEEFYDEEEEEDEEWPARGRKKPKPGRQTKVPKAPAKKPRRGGRF